MNWFEPSNRKQNRTAHRDKLLADYHYETDGEIRYGGWYDAPEDLVIRLKLYQCQADPQNPYSCVLANLLTQARNHLIPRRYGIIMRDGIYVQTGKAFIALLDPATKVFRHMKFEHDGHWVVRALDTRNPVHLQEMWDKVNKGKDVVTFKRPRPSQTKEGRALTASLPKPAKVKSVPQRGIRAKGMMSARRATANAILAEAIAKAAA